MRNRVGAMVGVVVLIAVVLWLWPKERVVGGLRGGPIGPGETAYREDLVCLGVKYDFCPNWPDYGCDRLCFGAVVDRTCSIESYEPAEGRVRTPTACQEAVRPRWWLGGR
jgi:hypothetical protein